MNSVCLDAYNAFHRSWALVTAGKEGHFNTMTVSWGGLGSLWNKSVATVYVRPNRYTYEFMEAYEYFTISFFPDDKKNALKILGTVSGRDTNKVSTAGLHPVVCGEGMTFAEAEMTILCRKIYCQDMDSNRFPVDVAKRYYTEEPPHRMYIGEIIEIRRED